MKILISDKLEDKGVNLLKKVSDFDVDVITGMNPEELKSVIKNYDAVIVRSMTTIDKDVISAADNLKFIGRAGVGLDNVDLAAATSKGIVVMNTPEGNTTSTAEHTMSLMLSLSRNIPQSVASLREGKWARSKFQGTEIFGKTLGIIGLGRIGSTVASFAMSFGMKVIAYDPYISLEIASKKSVDIVGLEVLLKESDYVSIHIPKSLETDDLISDKEFDIMKDTAMLINCARGCVVNEDALVNALENGKIAGAAIDVFKKEPPDFDSKIFKLDNCITTPHLGAATSEAKVNVALEIAESIRDALLGKGIVNAANFPSVTAEAKKILDPYINLGSKMGIFTGHLLSGKIDSVKIVYSGLVIDHEVLPVTLAMMSSLLTPIIGGGVNSINALDFLKERDIALDITNSDHDTEFVNCIKLEVKTDKEFFVLWGTLSGHNQPRIVRINNVYVEVVPEGDILFVNNNDKPGIVGILGTMLANENINIAAITSGRESLGGVTLTVVNVDGEIPAGIVDKISKTEDILFVKHFSI